MLNPTGREKASRIAKAFDELASTLEEVCAESPREFAVTMTKLEEACFFAKKAMAKQQVNTKLEI